MDFVGESAATGRRLPLRVHADPPRAGRKSARLDVKAMRASARSGKARRIFAHHPLLLEDGRYLARHPLGRIVAVRPGSGFAAGLNLSGRFGVTGRTFEETLEDFVGKNGYSILVVEDHADSAALLERLLTRLGHAVCTASGARQAEALAARRRYDVIISDMGLPDGDGCALFQSVRAMYPVKGIAVTGYGAAEDIAACRRAGFDAHLIKPVLFDQLKAALDGLGDEENPAASGCERRGGGS